MAVTTVAFYIGTPDTFAADAASAASKQGTFIAATSGATTLNGALNLAASMVVASCVPVTGLVNINGAPSVGPEQAASLALEPKVYQVHGYVWTLQTGGAI